MKEFALTPEEEEQIEEDIIKDLEHKKSMLKNPEFNNLFHFIARPNILNIPYKTIDDRGSIVGDKKEYNYTDRQQKRKHLEKTYVIYQILKDKGISDFHDLVNTIVGFFENRKKKFENAILQILEIQSN